MKAKLFLLSLFCTIFFSFSMCFALAADMDITSISALSASHDSAASGSFVLANTNSLLNITNISCSFNINGWSASCSSVPSILTSNSSQSVSFSVNVPKYTAPNVYTGTLTVNANLSNSNPVSAQKQFNVNVTPSASLDVNWLKEPSEVYQGESQIITLNVTNTGNAVSNINVNATVVNSMSYLSSLTLLPSASQALNFTINSSSSAKVGINTIKVNASARNDTLGISAEKSATDKSFSVVYPYCSVRNSGDIYIDSIVNENEIDDESYSPLDSFDVEIKVKNSNTEKTKYAQVEAALFYENGIVSDTEVEEKLKIAKNDYETITFTIKIPVDIQDGTHYLYVKAYDNDNKDNCQQRKVEISIGKESNQVIPIEVVLEPQKVNCSSAFKITGKLANIGSNDEDKVKVVFNDGFGNEQQKVFSSLKEGRKTSMFSFESTVAQDAAEGSHEVSLDVYYDYDDVNGNYDQSEGFNYNLAVEGNCYKEEKGFSLNVQPTAYVSKETDVIAVIENTGNINSTFKVTANANWAVIDSISPNEFSLDAGQSKSIAIKLTPNSGTTPGVHFITLNVNYAGKSESKTISVNVAEGSGASAGITGDFIKTIESKLRQNFSWMAIDIILFVAIVALVAYLIFKPKDAYMSSLLRKKMEAEAAIKNAEAKALK